MRSWRRAGVVVPLSVALLLATCLVALSAGRYPIPVLDVCRFLVRAALGWSTGTSLDPAAHDIVLLVRLPRVLLGVLVGGGLAASGVALQAVFRNPLVSPQIIGVSSGASFGGALAILLGLGGAGLVGLAFAFGLVALAVVFGVTVTKDGAPMLLVVLGGVVTGSLFSALVALVTYIADPYDQLPTIVFWLLGSLATATFTTVTVAVVPIVAGVAVLSLLRWRINVLSLGDEDASSVGVRPGPLRWTVLVAVTLVVAGAVAVSGVVSWVGLVIPHAVRMWVGPDHRLLLPVSCLVGSAFLVAVDTLARTVTAAEIPLGVLTALVGAPAFFVVLRRNRDRIWDRA